MIKIRRNFETNSSSMHSLAFRSESGDYTAEELKKIDDIVGLKCSDVILTLIDDNYPTLTERDVWIFSNKLRLWHSDTKFYNSAMEVLDSFRDKMRYYIASIRHSKLSAEKKMQCMDDLKNIIHNMFPDVEINFNEDDYNYPHSKRYVNNRILLKFLKENKISVEEFLKNDKYVVVVNYEEFLKMQFLDMVDMSKIKSVYSSDAVTADNEINIDENGIWSLSEASITFGRYPFRVLGTPEGKARYCLAAWHGENVDEIIEILQEVYPNLKSIAFPPNRWDETGFEYGYVEDCAYDYTQVSLRELILNKKYVIISDGDEYCVWNQFVKSSLFNKKAYEDRRESYEDAVENEDDI